MPTKRMRALAGDVPLFAALVAFVLHAAANSHYGFFRDELYFIACGRHPAWGYVDQPPLLPFVAAATQAFGPSLFVLRLVPALGAAAVTGVAVAFARSLGGDRFAQLLTALCVIFASDILLQGVLLTTDVFQPLVWTLAIALIARLIARGDDVRTGVALGIVLGLGANSKYAIAFFAVCAIAGLAVTPQRRVLACRSVLVASAIAVVTALPSVVWQALHGWPFIELLRNGANGKNVVLGPAAFPLAQLKMLNPFYAPVWLAGLWFVFRRAALRWIGWTYVAFYLVMFALHAKDYYLMPIYPALFAADPCRSPGGRSVHARGAPRSQRTRQPRGSPSRR